MDRKIISKKELNKYNKGLNFPWLVQMAWRDSRRNRSRLLLFIFVRYSWHRRIGCYLFTRQ